MAIEVFNRVEKKYIIGLDKYEAVNERLMNRMEEDSYNKGGGTYTISNLYYDTVDSSLIRHSLSKPVYKEKLRVRGYGVPELGDEVFVEMKKKFDGVVNKRRSAIKLADAYGFLSEKTLPDFQPYMNRQVLNEIAYFLNIHELEPKLYIAYDRRALHCVRDHDLRITFDMNIRSRRYDLRLEAGDYGDSLMVGTDVLMEIKTNRSIPVWLADTLSEMDIFPRSFSKYGNEYEKHLAQGAKEGADTVWTPYLAACSAIQQKPRYQLRAQ